MKKLLLILVSLTSALAVSQTEQDSMIIFDKNAEFIMKLHRSDLEAFTEKLYFYNPAKYDRLIFVFKKGNTYHMQVAKARVVERKKKPITIPNKI